MVSFNCSANLICIRWSSSRVWNNGFFDICYEVIRQLNQNEQLDFYYKGCVIWIWQGRSFK